MRLHGFAPEEIAGKGSLALAHRDRFPVRTALRGTLSRGPGFGTRRVDRILSTRLPRALRYDGLLRKGASLRKAAPLIELADRHPRALLDAPSHRARFAPGPEPLGLLRAGTAPAPRAVRPWASPARRGILAPRPLEQYMNIMPPKADPCPM